MRKNRTHEDYVEEMRLLHPNIEVLGKYTQMKNPVKLKCKIDGHEWDATPNNSIYGNHGCPVCAGRKVMRGVNDMWTTRPDIARLLADPEDGYKYSDHSSVVLKWKCPNCGEIIEKDVAHVTDSNGKLYCTICDDSVSYPEKFVYYFLKQAKENFKHQFCPKWIKRKKYDFYLPQYGIIIETNGKQHYEQIQFFGNRSLEEEIENDKYKEKMAIEHGINVIWLDCRKGERDYIRNSIYNSELSNILDLDNINWDVVDQKCQRSVIYDICREWDTGNYQSARQFAKTTEHHYKTILRYLKLGNEYGWCTYDPKLTNKIIRSQKVYQVSKNHNLIKVWSSATEIANTNFGSRNNLYKAIRGVRDHKFKGYYWYNEKDYNQLKIDLKET